MTLEDTVHTAYEAWSRRDIDALLEVVHPEAEARPILGANIGVSVYRGEDGMREWFRDLHQEWDQFQTRVVEIEASDERALLTVEIHARGRASGAVIEGDLYHLVEVRDGLIVRLEAFRDRDTAVKAFEAT